MSQGAGSRLRTGQNGAPGGLPVAGARPMGTASRLATAMRPGSRSGVGGMALNQQLRVEDRPMTQQGLTGAKTAGKGPRRLVEDKSYYIGLLRGKINELSVETNSLVKQLEESNEESTNFVQYEQMAETLAKEIKDLQSELGDYNTLVDKLNTDEDMGNVQMDFEELKASNDRAERSLDSLFEEKKTKEGNLRNLEVELEQERRMADTLVSNMEPGMRKKYLELKDLNDHLLRQLENGQQQLDQLNIKKNELEEELSMSQVKQEAMRLHEQIHELEMKRDQLLEESRALGDPQQERERLLKAVKDDNQEIASMERQTKELREKLDEVHEDLQMAERDMEESQGERSQKYRELKKREEQMDDFLQAYEATRTNELQRMSERENNVVALLEHMSRNMARVGHMPSPMELGQMREQLAFKEQEMKKSETTTVGLAGEHARLQQDLAKVDQLEAKITQEMQVLKEKIAKMDSELGTYSDLDRLKDEGEAKRKKLMEDKSIMSRRREYLKRLTQQLSAQYEAARTQLNDNETHAQLCNLERKWQHHEQNNFVMKEFIGTKTVESDFAPIATRVTRLVGGFNSQLRDELSRKAAL